MIYLLLALQLIHHFGKTKCRFCNCCIFCCSQTFCCFRSDGEYAIDLSSSEDSEDVSEVEAGLDSEVDGD